MNRKALAGISIAALAITGGLAFGATNANADDDSQLNGDDYSINDVLTPEQVTNLKGEFTQNVETVNVKDQEAESTADFQDLIDSGEISEDDIVIVDADDTSDFGEAPEESEEDKAIEAAFEAQDDAIDQKLLDYAKNNPVDWPADDNNPDTVNELVVEFKGEHPTLKDEDGSPAEVNYIAVFDQEDVEAAQN